MEPVLDETTNRLSPGTFLSPSSPSPEARPQGGVGVERLVSEGPHIIHATPGRDAREQPTSHVTVRYALTPRGAIYTAVVSLGRFDGCEQIIEHDGPDEVDADDLTAVALDAYASANTAWSYLDRDNARRSSEWIALCAEVA